MTRQTDTDNIVQLLKSPHFGDSGISTPDTGEPVTETMLVLTLDELTEYDLNPRRASNAEYDTLKASYIRTGADDTLLVVSRRPGEELYFPAAGGNTRLRILKELWEETGNGKYFRIHCKFQPFTDDVRIRVRHLAENVNRSGYMFIDLAREICDLYDELNAGEDGPGMSQRAFIHRLRDLGFPKLSRGQLDRFRYAMGLHAYIADALDSGMKDADIRKLQHLQKQLREFLDKGFGITPGIDIAAEFDKWWRRVLHDLDSPEGIDPEAVPSRVFRALASTVRDTLLDGNPDDDQIVATLNRLWKQWRMNPSASVSIRRGTVSERNPARPDRQGAVLRHFPEETREYTDAGGDSYPGPGQDGTDDASSAGTPDEQHPGGNRRRVLASRALESARSFGAHWGLDTLVGSLGPNGYGFWVDLPEQTPEEPAAIAWWWLFRWSGITDTPILIPGLLEEHIQESRLADFYLQVANGKASLEKSRIEGLPHETRLGQIMQAFLHVVENHVPRSPNHPEFFRVLTDSQYAALYDLINAARAMEHLPPAME